MAEDPLRPIVEAARARIQAELGAQLDRMVSTHEQALAEARREAEAAAEERWSVRSQDDSTDRAEAIRAAVATAHAEVEQRVAAEVTRVRIEADRQIAEEAIRHRAELSRRAAVAPDDLLHAFREIDATASVSDTLAAIARAASRRAARSAVFIANGTDVDEWAVAGLPAVTAADGGGDSATDLAVKALAAGWPLRDGRAVAAPLVLDGRPVGVLYGEANTDDDAGDGWTATVETLARHGGARLGYLTALRTAQAREWISGASAPADPSATADQNDDAQSARRYARLLVSEIKLYNEAAVRDGRGQRDLRQRLGPEIDRARRLYEARVPPAVQDRAEHFHQELVQTLAGGDASLLG